MLGLSGTRVIVVDDKEDEALPILKAFARRGVPCAFFNAPAKKALPRKGERLRGVRLAILDMDLVPGMASEAGKAAALANYLGNILSPDNGPYGVLAWTYHPEIVERFEQYVFAEASIPNPIFTLMIGKDQCFKKGRCDYSHLSTLIEAELGKNISLKLFEAWEETCFKAATSVTNTLSNLAINQAADLRQWRERWTTQLLQLLYTVARAEAEEMLDRNTCINALFTSLNPLHADRMENQMVGLCESLADNASDILGAVGNSGPERKAKLNTMLHLSLRDVRRFSMGNIYLFKQKRKPSFVPSCRELLKGNWVQGRNDEEKARHTEEIINAAFPVLIEISAACDHAQNKIQRARLLSGILVPVAHRKKLNRGADFVREFGPVHLEEPIVDAGIYYFYYSSRQVRSIEIDQVKKLNAAARLRGQALGELQAWLAQRESRPGIVLLRD